MGYKYDVFISYSRKDYVNNGEVIPGNPVSAIQNILTKNHISFWFDKDGIYSGDEFIEVITEAIVSSKMLIFVSSKASNLSEWTAGEILLAKKHKKAILPVRIDDSDYNRKFELVLLAHDFVNYYESEQESLEKILKAVKKNNEEIALQHVKAEIRELANDCLLLLNQQDTLVKTLVAKNLSVGVTTKDCPVCGKSTPLGDAFCGRCGWRFPVLYDLGNNQIPAGDKQHLSLARANWHKLSANVEAEVKAEKLEEENQELCSVLKRISEDRNMLTKKLSRSESDLQSSKAHVKELFDQLDHLQKIKLSLLNDISEMQGKLSASENECKVLKETLYKTQEELRMIKKERDTKEKELLDLTNQVSAYNTPTNFYLTAKEDQLTFTVKGVSFKMIRVRENGGPYYLGETQVTQDLWWAVMGNNPSLFKDEKRPVEKVSWIDCQKFLDKLNTMSGKKFRLPLDIEWVYAAMGGSMGRGYEYSGSNNINDVGWFTKNSGGQSHPVKTKKANELGLYDMSGNVLEWCEDAVGSNRVIRGGSWADNATCCSVGYRGEHSPSYRSNTLGFRLAL